jgi:hypothetical protein
MVVHSPDALVRPMKGSVLQAVMRSFATALMGVGVSLFILGLSGGILTLMAGLTGLVGEGDRLPPESPEQIRRRLAIVAGLVGTAAVGWVLARLGDTYHSPASRPPARRGWRPSYCCSCAASPSQSASSPVSARGRPHIRAPMATAWRALGPASVALCSWCSAGRSTAARAVTWTPPNQKSQGTGHANDCASCLSVAIV